MKTTLPSRSDFGKRALPAALLAALAAWGCRGRSEGYERYVPPPGPARAALAAVLDAWRDGHPPEEAVGPRGNVHVVDKQRRPGQRLAQYEILGEIAADNARGFAVRLTLEDPDEHPVVRFLVLGVEPLWVFRQDDFEMISHWMHPMDEPKDRPADPSTRP
jgi:hypothetical protein